MKGENLIQAIEDYLKTIYELSAHHDRVSTSQIAKAMEVKPGSVTGMVQKLASADPPLVDYRKHRGVMLTQEGECVALQTIRNHRLLEKFLHETMGFPWDEVHEEADQLEHVISPAFEERMTKVLNDPLYDPHGAPIPTRDLQMPAHSKHSIGDLRSGHRGVIQRVPDDDPDLLRYLDRKGVIPNAEFEIMEYSPFDRNLKIRMAGRDEPVVLGPRITHQIYVAFENVSD